MQLELLNEQGQAASKFDAPETVFGREYNEALVHQIVVAFQANARQGTRAQKDREQVKHSTKKPFRQKGTGRARAGMTSSPLWRGGGRIFPNSPDENFTQKINKKMYRAGMASIFSQLARDGRLAVVDSLKVDSPKTKQLAAKFKAMNLESVHGHRRRSRREPVPVPRATWQRAHRRAALRRSAVPGALQEGAGHQGCHGQAQGDVRMSRVNPTPAPRQVRRRPPDVRAGRPDRLREGDARGRQDQFAVTFKVLQDATKPEIKAAVELMFNVQVKGVSVLNTKGKTKRFGRSMGRRDNVRKAYVTLQPGQELNFSGEAA
jgi:large subunit ribosomal protein L4